MSHPLVTVVVTVYQRTDFLASALESVVAQTFRDLEVIVADDSGNAGARSIVARFSDPRIRYSHGSGSNGRCRGSLLGADR